jgi:hypothetical protein
MDNNNNNSPLYQRAGEIIVYRYKNVKDIPEKYKFLYVNYIPPSVGVKRKFDDCNV